MNTLDVRIPYGLNRELGDAYNKIFETVDDWVLIIDHDVLLLNPNWCAMCIDTIAKVGHDAGWITCRTNTGRPEQKIPSKNDLHYKLDYHLALSKYIYDRKKGSITDITNTCSALAGFFILTRKKVWEAAGGFKKGFLGVDFDYCRKVKNAGYRLYVMEDLYVYHFYNRHWKVKDFEP